MFVDVRSEGIVSGQGEELREFCGEHDTISGREQELPPWIAALEHRGRVDGSEISI